MYKWLLVANFNDERHNYYYLMLNFQSLLKFDVKILKNSLEINLNWNPQVMQLEAQKIWKLQWIIYEF